MKKVLFICPYPAGLAPSQRFRFEQYLSQLEENGFQTEIKPFFSLSGYNALYQSGKTISKVHLIIQSYLKRLSDLFRIARYDYVFIHREATPVGPPIIEWIIAKVARKKIIYDFDDAIWTTDQRSEWPLAKLIRWRSKVASVCTWSYRVSCGNRYLARFAARYQRDVVINPTTIDTADLHFRQNARDRKAGAATIGWTGSRSTLKYLDSILPALQLLEKKYPAVHYLIIADRDPGLRLDNYEFRAWQKQTEISDLEEVDIGIMPLPDDSWTRGKCGFKALQYMALEIPAVVSPVGVNSEIVEHGIDGYCCTDLQEWVTYLEALILDPDKRAEMGRRGRLKVIDRYSVAANSSNFLSLFQ